MGIENWELIEDGIGYAETLATCAEEALVIAKTRINPKDYPDRPHYVVVEVVCHGTGGYGREVVVMQPAPPLCVGEAKQAGEFHAEYGHARTELVSLRSSIAGPQKEVPHDRD